MNRRFHKIIIIRLSSLGDIVKTIPVINVIKSNIPEAKITWLVEDRFEHFLELVDGIDEIIIFPKKLLIDNLLNHFFQGSYHLIEYLKLLSTYKFDLLLDFQNNLKSALHCKFIEAKCKVGFARYYSKENSDLFYDVKIVPENYPCYGVDKNINLLKQLGFRIPDDIDIKWKIKKGTVEEVQSFISKLPHEKFFLLHPFVSKRGISKMWPLERYVELAGIILNRFKSTPVFSIEPGDLQTFSFLREKLKQNFYTLPQGTSLEELIVLIKHAKLFIGSDSAPLHLAYLLRTPSIAILGGSYYQFFLPPKNSIGVVVRKNDGKYESVNPHYVREKYNREDFESIEKIMLGDVVSAIKSFIDFPNVN